MDISAYLVVFPYLLGSPVITTAPPPLITVKRLYDTVILQCAAKGSPVPTLEWSKDGVVISNNTTSTTDVAVNGKLVISKFNATDQGVYKCFFKNYDNGTAETTTTAGKLHVYCTEDNCIGILHFIFYHHYHRYHSDYSHNHHRCYHFRRHHHHHHRHHNQK